MHSSFVSQRSRLTAGRIAAGVCSRSTQMCSSVMTRTMNNPPGQAFSADVPDCHADTVVVDSQRIEEISSYFPGRLHDCVRIHLRMAREERLDVRQDTGLNFRRALQFPLQNFVANLALQLLYQD